MLLSAWTLFDVRSMIKEAKRFNPKARIIGSRVNTNLVENIFCQQPGYHEQNDNPRYDQ